MEVLSLSYLFSFDGKCRFLFDTLYLPIKAFEGNDETKKKRDKGMDVSFRKFNVNGLIQEDAAALHRHTQTHTPPKRLLSSVALSFGWKGISLRSEELRACKEHFTHSQKVK